MAPRFVCELCLKFYFTRCALIEHQKKKHEVISQIDVTRRYQHYECNWCAAVFKFKREMRLHISRHMHPRGQLVCPVDHCSSFTTHRNLVRHLQTDHQMEIEVEEMAFPNMQAYEKWKANLTEFSIKKLERNSTEILSCSRSGVPDMRPRIRKGRIKRSKKIGSTCPARYIARLSDEVRVTHYMTHVGHEAGLRYQRLTKAERSLLAAKMASGISMSRILEDIQQSISEGSELQRIHLVTRTDLHNIKRDFKIRPARTPRLDASTSTALWVQRQVKYGKENPVVFHKVRGEKHPTLDENQFMLIMMTPYQKMMLWDAKQTGSLSRILVDSTDDCLGHEFQVATLAAIDESGAGCPLATCFCSYIDENSMTNFFLKIKEVVGTFDVDVFMSEDSFVFYNAWCNVMQEASRVLLSTWHLDHAWRRNLKTVTNPVTRTKIYVLCRRLINSANEKDFYHCLVEFLSSISSSEETVQFSRYFERYYTYRTEQWGLCFRTNLGLVNNTRLEAIHKKFMYCYNDGRERRRIDKCISLWMLLTRSLMLNATKNAVQPTSQMLSVGLTHRESFEIPDGSIAEVSRGVFRVNCAEDEVYNVVISDVVDLCLGCSFTCHLCSICPHRASCDCFDSEVRGNICKHVHACWRKMAVSPLNPEENQETCDEYEDDELGSDYGDEEVKYSDVLKLEAEKLGSDYGDEEVKYSDVLKLEAESAVDAEECGKVNTLKDAYNNFAEHFEIEQLDEETSLS